MKNNSVNRNKKITDRNKPRLPKALIAHQNKINRTESNSADSKNYDNEFYEDDFEGSNTKVQNSELNATFDEREKLQHTLTSENSIVDKFMVQKTTIDNFRIMSKLGEGSYSTVYKAVRKQDGKIYSLKKVRIIQGLSDKERENSINEVRILASIKNNVNVVRYYEAFMDQVPEEQTNLPSPYLYIVMEYADSGDLYQKI